MYIQISQPFNCIQVSAAVYRYIYLYPFTRIYLRMHMFLQKPTKQSYKMYEETCFRESFFLQGHKMALKSRELYLSKKTTCVKSKTGLELFNGGLCCWGKYFLKSWRKICCKKNTEEITFIGKQNNFNSKYFENFIYL